MVQKVQTAVGEMQPTTLDTIEAVGTSSRKLRDGRQTTGERFLGYCTTTEWTNLWTRRAHWARQSSLIQITGMDIDTCSSNYIYIMKDGGLRVPRGWTYEVEITWAWGNSSMSSTLFVKVGKWGQTLYTETSTNPATQTDTITVNLGKFDTITLWTQYYWSWSDDTSISTGTRATLKITEL